MDVACTKRVLDWYIGAICSTSVMELGPDESFLVVL